MYSISAKLNFHFMCLVILMGKHSVRKFGPQLNHRDEYNLLTMEGFSKKFGALLKCRL